MINKLTQFSSGMYQQAATDGYLTLDQMLADMSRKGDISEDLVRVGPDAPRMSGRPLTPTLQIMAASGVRWRGARSSTGAIFSRKSTDYIPGMEHLFASFMADQMIHHRQRSLEESVVSDSPYAVDTFFTQPDSPGDVLFPTTVVNRFVDYTNADQPRNEVMLSDLVSSTVTINGTDYKTGVIERDAAANLEPGRVAEATRLPLYTLTTGERTVGVYKYGARVRGSYEVLRRQQLNQLGRTMQEIGRMNERRKVKDAIAAALNGDGNSNPAINTDTATSGVWDFEDFDALMKLLNDYGSEETLAIADGATLLEILAMRFGVANLPLSPDQLAMYGGGALMTPNRTPLKFAPVGSALVGSDSVLIKGANAGLERIIEQGSVIREADRFIEDQTQVFTMSENEGYAKPAKYGWFTLTKAA